MGRREVDKGLDLGSDQSMLQSSSCMEEGEECCKGLFFGNLRKERSVEGTLKLVVGRSLHSGGSKEPFAKI